jgi:hypothetical protein
VRFRGGAECHRHFSEVGQKGKRTKFPSGAESRLGLRVVSWFRQRDWDRNVVFAGFDRLQRSDRRADVTARRERCAGGPGARGEREPVVQVAASLRARRPIRARCSLHRFASGDGICQKGGSRRQMQHHATGRNDHSGAKFQQPLAERPNLGANALGAGGPQAALSGFSNPGRFGYSTFPYPGHTATSGICALPCSGHTSTS